MASALRTRLKSWIAAAAGISAAGMLAQAGAQDRSLTVEVGQCVDLPTPEQRLACFERQVEAARNTPEAAPAATGSAAPAAPSSAAPAAPSAAAPTATTTIAVPAATSSVPAEFGFPQRREESEKPAPPPDLFAKVTALRETVPHAFLITLDNGQVWRQTRPDSSERLKVGSDVRIYLSRWRAYRLESSDVSGFLQVERVR